MGFYSLKQDMGWNHKGNVWVMFAQDYTKIIARMLRHTGGTFGGKKSSQRTITHKKQWGAIL
jgi:hypothetical protein